MTGVWDSGFAPSVFMSIMRCYELNYYYAVTEYYEVNEYYEVLYYRYCGIIRYCKETFLY